jgi:hypothetical protein
MVSAAPVGVGPIALMLWLDWDLKMRMMMMLCFGGFLPSGTIEPSGTWHVQPEM